MDTVQVNDTLISSSSWRHHSCLFRNKGNVKTLQKSASLLNTEPSVHFQYSTVLHKVNSVITSWLGTEYSNDRRLGVFGNRCWGRYLGV